MSINPSAPWHRASFDRFLKERLPELLAERLPLTSYRADSAGRYTCQVVITLASASGDVEIAYTDLPQPDEDGIFKIEDESKDAVPAASTAMVEIGGWSIPWHKEFRVVVPTASTEKLDVAEIRCMGEQLYDYVEQRLAQAPSNGLPWDAELMRTWLPLDAWIDEFLDGTVQRLEGTNWLAHHTHLRSLLVLDKQRVITPGQFGRVCPFETPEGSNTGRILRVAVGAEIRENKLVVTDERPGAGLGLSASMIPFLEHDDPFHLLMGANMLRQWIVQSTPEPALVQTGNEPDAPGFWAGRNLLTAFVSWGTDTFASGITVSESAAGRFDTPYGLEPGDKMSNRHGIKGVVSRVLPDDEMPHLPNGTPVELVFSFAGLHTHIGFGQVLEAVMGRIARAEGAPAFAPPFNSPSRDELRERLAQAGLPESGMETLMVGKNGSELQRPSTIGWVYWGRLAHLARSKVKVSPSFNQMLGELETYALRDVGAYENLREYLNIRAVRRPDTDTLAARVAAGPVAQAGPPTPMFSDLARRLAVAGIQVALEIDRLTFRLAPPQGDVVELARPVPHPWLRERELTEVGAYPELHEYDLLVAVNDRLARMLQSQTPEKLIRDAVAQLETRADAFFDALLTPDHLRFQERQLFSGRAVIAPSANLRLDQVALADEIAWTLFAPLVIRELGDEDAVYSRSERAARVLDQVMARSWVIVNRAPTFSPTALIAFHPVRDPDSVVRLHPLVCEMLNADFDGDQVALLLPITEEAQREAGARLSVTGHLARDPGLLELLLPPADALWGLANLSLIEEGRREIARLAEVEVASASGPITRTMLAGAMHKLLEQDGIDAVLSALERLMQRGFQVAKASGASLSPFIGTGLERPTGLETDDPDLRGRYAEELTEQLASRTDYSSAEFGPQLLAVKSSERGLHQLTWLLGIQDPIKNAEGNGVVIRHGYGEGLTPGEMRTCTIGVREGIAEFLAQWDQMTEDARNRHRPGGFHVLARARRASRPGIVFARAAAISEVDPLTDVYSRLLVGLPAKAQA